MYNNCIPSQIYNAQQIVYRGKYTMRAVEANLNMGVIADYDLKSTKLLSVIIYFLNLIVIQHVSLVELHIFYLYR